MMQFNNCVNNLNNPEITKRSLLILYFIKKLLCKYFAVLSDFERHYKTK